MDHIESKLNSLGLTIPQKLKVPPDVKTPSAWIRLRGNKAYISGHGPQNSDGSVGYFYDTRLVCPIIYIPT